MAAAVGKAQRLWSSDFRGDLSVKDRRGFLGCDQQFTAVLEEFETAFRVGSSCLWFALTGGFVLWWGWLSLVALQLVFCFSGSHYPRAVTSHIQWLPGVNSFSSLYLTERQYWVSFVIARLTSVTNKYVSRHLDPCTYTFYRGIRCDPSRACGKIKYWIITCYQEHVSSWVSQSDTGSNLFKRTFLGCQQHWGHRVFGVRKVRSQSSFMF